MRRQKVKKPSIRKSCDLCNRRKKKCDGDGVNHCSLCIEKGQAKCVYSPRQPQKPRRPRADTPFGRGAQRRPTNTAIVTKSSVDPVQFFKRCRLGPSTATGLVGTEENIFLHDFFSCMGFLPLTCQQTVREAMVKVVLGQTWLTGPEYDRNLSLIEDPEMGAMIPASNNEALSKSFSSMPSDPSLCMFWCAVALGGLVAGRPMSRVVPYVERAYAALQGAPGADKTNTARAWAVMAYLYGFCGESESAYTESYFTCQRRAESYLGSSAQNPEEEEFRELVKHAGGIGLFYGSSGSSIEFQNYLDDVEPHPEPPSAVTQSSMCMFVMKSYRRLGQAFMKDILDEEKNKRGDAIAGPGDGLVGEIEGGYLEGDEEDDDYAALRAELCSDDEDLDCSYGVENGIRGGVGTLALANGVGGAAAAIQGTGGGLSEVVVMAGEKALEPPRADKNMGAIMLHALPAYEALLRAVDICTAAKASDHTQARSSASSVEDLEINLKLSMMGDAGGWLVLAAGAAVAATMMSFVRNKRHRTRPQIRSGIGGLMINSSMVVLKAVQNDFNGSFERVSRCVEVMVRYPGLCRFPMSKHISHLLISALAGLEKRELYEVLRKAYNSTATTGTVHIPPFEEWKGIEACCGHVYCRSVEKRFARKRGVGYSPSGSSSDSSFADTSAAVSFPSAQSSTVPSVMTSLKSPEYPKVAVMAGEPRADSRYSYVASDGDSSSTLPLKRSMMSDPQYTKGTMTGQPRIDIRRASVVSDGDGDTVTPSRGCDLGGLVTNRPVLSASSSSSLLSQDDLDPIATTADYGYPPYLPTSVTASVESESVAANSVSVGGGSGTGRLEVGVADWAKLAGTFTCSNTSNTDMDTFGRASLGMSSEGGLAPGAAGASTANYGGNIGGSSPSPSHGMVHDMSMEIGGANLDAEVAEVAEVMALREFASEFEESIGVGNFWEDLDMMASEQSRRNAGVVG